MADRGEAQGTLLDDALRSTTRAVASAPKVTLLLVLVVSGICVALTICFLGYKTNRADLIDPAATYQKRWLAYTQNFGAGSDIVAVVESDHPASVRGAIDELGGRVSGERELFANVLYRIEATGLRRKGLQFLPPDQIQAALHHLDRYGPVVRGNWDRVRLEDVSDRLTWQIGQTEGRQQEALIAQAEQLTDSLTRFVGDPRDFQSPWPELFSVDPLFRQATERQVYLVARSGTMGFVQATPRDSGDELEGHSASIERFREIADEVMRDRPDVKITLTGIPVLEHDEMQRSNSDMTIASVVSFLGVGLLLLIGFRGVRHPMLAMVMLGVGLSWAFGFATFSVGHLNILSISFAAMLIGLGGDFAIHYLSRYLEERHNGLDLIDALEATSVGIGSGLVTAALTTSLAFFCATFTQFLGVAELGIIAGGGILLCSMTTFIALPALIALGDENIPAESLPRPFRNRWLRGGTSKFPRTAVLLSIAVIVGVTVCAFRMQDNRPEPIVKFDHNLLNLQAEGLESVEVLDKLQSHGGRSLLFAVSMAESPAEALALKAKFEALPSVGHVEELASRLPQSSSPETRRLISEVRSRLSGLPASAPTYQPPSPASVGRSLERLYQAVRGQGGAPARRLADKLNTFLNTLESLPFAEQRSLLGQFQQRMAQSLLMQFQVMSMAASDTEPLSIADFPREMTSRFVRFDGPRQTWLLQIHPKEPIWEFEPLARFVADVRSVDPDVTGTPLQNFEASRQIKSSYEHAALYALVVISLVLLMSFLDRDNKLLVLVPPLVVIAFTAMTLSTRGAPIHVMYLVLGYLGMVVAMAAVLDFRNLRDAAMTFIPPLAAGAMSVGVLALLKHDFNAANLIVLPLILGIGVDNGVYVVHNYRSQRGRQFTLDASTASAMVITSITNMIGFGSLMIAAHRGLYSVGLVLTIGVACTLFVSLTTLPALLSWISREPGAQRSQGGRSMSDDDLEAATRPDKRQRQQQHRRAA